MKKFKKFIITKILRETIYSPPVKQEIKLERCDVETIGVEKRVSDGIPKEWYRDEIACSIGRYLMKSGFITVKISRIDPWEKHIFASVDVVRRSTND